ncbi:MAG: hypothetical protein V3T14_06680 [Myxococcota bacterium]
MIQVEINGDRRTLDPASIDELRGFLRGAVSPAEVLCSLRVNGDEVSEDNLATYRIGAIQNLEVQTARSEDLARSAIPEAIDWMGRLQKVLRGIAEDFRAGRDREAADRLVPVADALQVLMGLLSGIREFTQPKGSPEREAWSQAESHLKHALQRFVSAFERNDSVRLSDLLTHEIPAALEAFVGPLSTAKACDGPA